MSSDNLVLSDVAGGVATITLNRPDASNGMNVEFLKALCDAIMGLHGRPDVRVALIRGAGKNFCAGGDVHTFASKGEHMPDYLRVATAWLQNAVTGLMRLEAPVIAAVHGYALGAGCSLAFGSDLVVAAESARFGYPELRAGLTASTVTAHAVHVMGRKIAFELLMLCENITPQRATTASRLSAFWMGPSWAAATVTIRGMLISLIRVDRDQEHGAAYPLLQWRSRVAIDCLALARLARYGGV